MTELERYRRQKDSFFKSDPHSPLSKEQKRAFKGPGVLPGESGTALRCQGRALCRAGAHPDADQHRRVQNYAKYGALQFTADGQAASLTVYTSEDGEAFIPFTDATSGDETYATGRYLDLERHDSNLFHVDFNQAYNPWCAYSPNYSCPIPPRKTGFRCLSAPGRKISGTSRPRASGSLPFLSEFGESKDE